MVTNQMIIEQAATDLNTIIQIQMVKRILIIEDDLDILEILDIIFLDEGYDIISHRKGLSADEIGLLHPDLLLLDVRISGSQIRSHIVLINRKQVHNRFV